MSDLILPRRRFLIGLGATLAAPAIVKASSLMKLTRPAVIRPSPAVVGQMEWGPSGFGPITVGSTLNGHPIVRADGSQLQPGDIKNGHLIVVYNGRNWVLLS